MSSIWFKNNKLIFDGGLVFCDECPCGGGEFPGCENLAEEYLIVAGTYMEIRYHEPIDVDGCDGDIYYATRVELLKDCVVTKFEEQCYWQGIGLTRSFGGEPENIHWNLSLVDPQQMLAGDGETWFICTTTTSAWIKKPKGVGPAGQYAANVCVGPTLFDWMSFFSEGEVTEVAP
jgi:hypothetical protein